MAPIFLVLVALVAAFATIHGQEGEGVTEELSLDEQAELFRPLLEGPRQTHCGEVRGPVPGNRSPYAPATPPPCSFNRHGETEFLEGVEMMHHFVEADGVKWHFVTAGDRSNPPLLFIHGLPESWFGFHHQVAALSDDYYCIAVDMIGYGQSDKRLTLDLSFPGMAKSLTALLELLGVDSFYLVTHDRGSVVGDNLTAVPGMEQRIQRWVRMQQSANEPHGYPRPPHGLFGSDAGVEMFSRQAMINFNYDPAGGYVGKEIPTHLVDRIAHEWLVEGVAEAVRANFQTSNFDIELEERMRDGGLKDTMTMPILFLQGALDPGQKPEEYKDTAEVFGNPENIVVMLEGASHFTATEQPELVSLYIRLFIEGRL
ncbi:MAG: alpha/beta hydrolase [Planctomycetota bacterium]